VVIYVAHDRLLSEPILRQFQQDTGIRVRAIYDLEANKTIGLTNRLIAERPAPRADLFWNNEVIQTLRLQSRQVAAVEPLTSRSPVSLTLADPERRWIGFAARARVLLANTRLVNQNELAAGVGLWDLTQAAWRGRAAVANPRFGTTGTHFAALLTHWGDEKFRSWLRALRANEIAVLPGNAQVRDAVVSGRYALGLTDTDDAVGALIDRAPVRIVWPDQMDGPGTLLIPNTLALIHGAPHRATAARLVDYLLSDTVEALLARGRGAQIPINHKVDPPQYLPPLDTIRVMPVDFGAVASSFERMLAIVDEEWPPGAAQTSR
jgi:iron(III) transport system substrate-binding protein